MSIGFKRIYNTGDKPIAFAYGGDTYVFQPKGGGCFEPCYEFVDKVVVEGELYDAAKAPTGSKPRAVRAVEQVFRPTRPKPQPDYQDVPVELAQAIMSGQYLAKHKGVLREENAVIADRESALAEVDRLRQEIAKLEQQKASAEEARIVAVAAPKK